MSETEAAIELARDARRYEFYDTFEAMLHHAGSTCVGDGWPPTPLPEGWDDAMPVAHAA